MRIFIFFVVFPLLCHIVSFSGCNHGSFQFACRSSATRKGMEGRADQMSSFRLFFFFGGGGWRKDVRDRVQSKAEFRVEYPLQDGPPAVMSRDMTPRIGVKWFELPIYFGPQLHLQRSWRAPLIGILLFFPKSGRWKIELNCNLCA